MLAFSMLAFTGFSTENLTKTDNLIFTIDDDVGYDGVTINTVDFKTIINAKSFAMHSRTQNINKMLFEAFDYTFNEIQESYRQISLEKWQPPERNKFNSPGLIYRTPRDSL